MATEARSDDAPVPDVEAQPEPDTTTTTAAASPPPGQQQQAPREQQQADEAPGSPPLPARHTPAAPGPRAARLQQLYGEALQHALGKVAAWDNFAGCYPTVAARAEGVLRQVQAQMVEKLGEKCQVGPPCRAWRRRDERRGGGADGHVEGV